LKTAVEKAEEGNFEVLLTVDQNIRYQQNLKGRSIAIVVMIQVESPSTTSCL
jgi:hypothetical protein